MATVKKFTKKKVADKLITALHFLDTKGCESDYKEHLIIEEKYWNSIRGEIQEALELLNDNN